MLHRLLPRGLAGVRERAKFIGVPLALLVLKGVGIDGVEPKFKLRRFLPQRVVVIHDVPWKMRRDHAGAARQLVNDAAIFQLVMDVARFARARKAGKARAACANAPGWHSHGIGHCPSHEVFDFDTTPVQLPGQMGKVFPVGGKVLVIVGCNKTGCDGERHAYLVNDARWPASTFRIFPVDLFDASLANQYTASAMSSG